MLWASGVPTVRTPHAASLSTTTVDDATALIAAAARECAAGKMSRYMGNFARPENAIKRAVRVM
jgi:hypothetical protein